MNIGCEIERVLFGLMLELSKETGTPLMQRRERGRRRIDFDPSEVEICLDERLGIVVDKI